MHAREMCITAARCCVPAPCDTSIPGFLRRMPRHIRGENVTRGDVGDVYIYIYVYILQYIYNICIYLYPSLEAKRGHQPTGRVSSTHTVQCTAAIFFPPGVLLSLSRGDPHLPRAHARVTHVACGPDWLSRGRRTLRGARPTPLSLLSRARKRRDERRDYRIDVDERTERKFVVRAVAFAGWARGFITPRSQLLAIHPFLPPPRRPPPQSEDAYCASP